MIDPTKPPYDRREPGEFILPRDNPEVEPDAAVPAPDPTPTLFNATNREK